ncbi:signal recognition particle-docking protein FtsY [Celeribacter sp.]|uniref:signal recognition particle-docking protein FtsY n=1 Tax=Celeribacter sp. TaxID=1890673 RepID=UPI003A92090E
MSLFGKLKKRLFKSSSKIDEGLEAIVADGGVDSGAEEAYVEEVVGSEPEAAPVEAPIEVPQEPPVEAPVKKPAEEPLEPPVESPVAPPVEEPAPEPEIAPQGEPEIVPSPAPDAPVVDAPAPQTEEAPIEDAPVSDVLEEIVEATAAPSPVEVPVKKGFLGRLMGRKETKTVVRRALDDDMLEQLEELLISTDMGVDTSLRVTAAMAEGRFGKKLSVEEIKRLMAQEIARIMEPVAKPMPLYPQTPQVVLVVGVNGSGKTTTIGKLASQFKAAGKSVVIAAGDTFRAAAVEQLQVWGERAGVPVLTAPEGSDPASLAFDAMTKAQEIGADLLMIDTAGRLQNRTDLMEELAKIVRVIRKKDPTAPHNTLLVLDATTGQNALNQVETFQKISDVSGLVMTKLDGTAKGGVLVSLADRFGLPIHAIGVGEQIDDLAPFDPEEFAAALTGLEV